MDLFPENLDDCRKHLNSFFIGGAGLDTGKSVFRRNVFRVVGRTNTEVCDYFVHMLDSYLKGVGFWKIDELDKGKLSKLYKTVTD